MNVDIGGCKGRKKYSKEIQQQWRTLDVSDGANIKYDLNSGGSIPLCDGVVSNYYASHVLEHVRMERLPNVFAEIYRTLGSGGRIRIVVPDISEGIGWYCSEQERLYTSGPTFHSTAPNTALGRLLCWIYTPDKGKYAGHCMAFDLTTLEWYLNRFGFRNIRNYQYQQGSPVFAGLDKSRYKGWCLFVEAEK